MNLARPFVLRPVMTTLLMIPLIVFGFFAYKLLPVSTIPFIQPPIIQVTTNYPGASPDEMARLVAGPLERQFMLMQGVQFVASQNDYESSTIICQFHDGVNIDVAAQEVQNAIDKAQGQLPTQLPNPPVYTKTNPSDTPILYCALTSEIIPPDKLYEYAYTFLGQQIGTVDGVANIGTYGYPYAVRVAIDPEALAAKQITLDQVAAAINNENPDQPTGKFYGPNKSMLTNTKGQIYKAEDYNSLIIKYQNENPVRIQDIGRAYGSLQNDKVQFKWITHDKKEEAVVVLAIFKQQGFNTLAVCTQIQTLLDHLKKDLPPSINFQIPFTQATFIKEAVEEVQLTLIIAFLLVVVVVFVYLGKIRNSLIPLLTLPITITGTFVFMYIFDFSIDIMSMSALTLAIGFLIDDAIVVLENIVRYVEQGNSPYQATLKGSKQIILTVISISLCLAIVFVPLLFLQGMIGAIFHEFAAVILLAILFSAFISLSLTPMLCSRFIPAYSEHTKTKIERFSDSINEKLIQLYKPSLTWALHHKKWVVVFCIGTLVLSSTLFFTLPKEFLPADDLGSIQGFLVTPSGTAPEKTDKILKQVETICMDNPYVDTMVRMSGIPTDNQALMFINLVERSKRPDIWKVISQINAKAAESLVGVQMFLKSFPLINLQVGSSTSGKANYQYILQSIYPDILYEAAPKYIEALRQRKELKQVSSDLLPQAPMLSVEILRDQAHSYNNLNATDVENAFMYTYGETYISKINQPQNMYYVILEGDKNTIRDYQKLSQLYTAKGNTSDATVVTPPDYDIYNSEDYDNEDPNSDKDLRQTAIDSIVRTKVVPGAIEVNHLNTLSSVTIAFDPGDGFALSDAISAIEEEAQKYLPAEVIKNLAGNTAAFKKTFMQLSILILLAIFVIYIILGILYENFLYPLVPLSSLPVAVLGGLLTLLVFQERLSIYALIGLIMLIGIVMKNGILVVDFALEEMNENKKEPYEAVVSACLIRFRPIIMTTFAAMMGSVPIALGFGGTVAKGRAPLGMVVVGGLLFAQIVTLFVIPSFYLYVHQLQKYLQEKFAIFRQMHVEE